MELTSQKPVNWHATAGQHTVPSGRPVDSQPPLERDDPASSFAQADLLPALRRYRWTLIAATLIAGAVAYLASSVQAPVYQAESRLLLEDPRDVGVFGDGAQLALDPQRYVRNQAEYINSASVLARTMELYDGQLDLDEIDRRVEARAGVDLDLVTIVAEDSSPKGAARLANAAAEAYEQLVTEEVAGNAEDAVAELSEKKAELRATITSAERRLEQNPDDSAAAAERDAAVSQLITIEGRSDQLSVDASLYGSGVKLLEQAEAPDAPARPQPLRNALVAGVLALLGAITFAWWRSGQAQTADDPHDPAAVLHAPLLGEIPRFEAAGVEGPTPTILAPHSGVAEAYQFVLTALDFVFDGEGAKTIMVTSSKPHDGKTVTALNMAVAANAIGRRVVLVDADKRRRGLTSVVGRDDAPGLVELADGASSPVGSCVHALGVESDRAVAFVPAGRELDDPAAFFRTARFRQAFGRLRDFGELMIVDSPPLLAVADTSAIAGQVDGIVIVVERGTPRQMLEDLRHRLDFVGTPVLGYVFNRADPHSRRNGYDYGAYGYGQHETSKSHKPVERRSRRRGQKRKHVGSA